MKVVLIITLSLCLMLMLWQDLKFRKIHAMLPVIVFVCSAALGSYSFAFHMKHSICNIGFFVATLFILAVYLKFKSGNVNIFTSVFGLGDALFYIGVSPLFLFREFILFFIYSLMVSIALHLILHRKAAAKSVPLAGFASLGLLMVILKDVLFSDQFFGTIINY